MLWHQNSGAKPMPLNSGAIAFLVPNSLLLTWHHFLSLAPKVWHHHSQCSKRKRYGGAEGGAKTNGTRKPTAHRYLGGAVRSRTVTTSP
ncbi:hypothetical protein Tco_0055872, partial [Tanacetum coccineum]